MSRIDKKLTAMRNNPQDDWKIEDLKNIAQRYNIDFRQPGTSHMTFSTYLGLCLTVPAHKPIKAVYIKRFIEDGGGYLAEAFDLNGCIADGDTVEEAIYNLEDAITSWITTAQELGSPIPVPSDESKFSGKWVVRTPRSLHRKLVEYSKHENVSLNTLVVSLLAEGIGHKSHTQSH